MTTHCLSARCLLHCGRADKFRQTDGGLAAETEGEEAVYVSRLYDSGREGTEWNHVFLDIGRDVVPQLYVWLFDRTDGEQERLLQDDVRAWFNKNRETAQYHSNYRNMLLYGNGGGRYARLAVRLPPGSGKAAAFRGYDLSFPRESFTDYLPAIYRDNPVLQRFLAVHQNIYLELEALMDSLPEKLDHELCGRNQAVRLARWLGWGELARQVEEDVLRKLLQRGIFLAKKKGTCSYYVEMAEILTGRKAVMIEEAARGRAVVLIWEQPEKGRERHLEWLKRNVPIGLEIEFVILHATDRLDGQCFLDRTAYLAEYESELTKQGCPIESLRLL